MKKVLKIRKLEIFLAAIIVVTMIMIELIFSDTSNVQSAQQIDMSVKPCDVTNDPPIEVDGFQKGYVPYVLCGEILSKYLPLDLRYSLKDVKTDEYVFLSVYRKVEGYQFRVILPDNLDIGVYEFEIKSGRRQVALIHFKIAE